MGVLFETTDLDAAQHELSRQYGPVRLTAAGDRRHMRLTRDGLGPVQLNRITFDMTLVSDVSPLDSHVIGRVVGGTAALETGHRHDAYGAGEAFVAAQAGEPHRAHLTDLDAEFATVPPGLVAEVAETSARQVVQPVRFAGYHPVSRTAARFWEDTYAYVREALDTPVVREPLVAGSLARLLVASALSVFPNTAVVEPTAGDRRDAHPATLRRAMTFIEDNAERDLSPAEIAAAAFVSIRAVQLAFRRHLGLTPMACLRRVRLEHAHQALMSADPARETVSTVAAHWGFPNHSRFSSQYRAAFGVAPSVTLRRG